MLVPAVGDRDPNDLRQNSSALFPSESYVDFLQQANIQKKIGAEVQYLECPDEPYNLFVRTGDVRFCHIFDNKVRTYIDLKIQRGLKILIWYEHIRFFLLHLYKSSFKLLITIY